MTVLRIHKYWVVKVHLTALM